MEKFKGTPNNWKLGTLDSQLVPESESHEAFLSICQYIRNDAGKILAEVKGFDTDGFVSPYETKANAKLIASAPELLEALQNLIDAVEEMESTDQYLSEAKQAINKALGINQQNNK